jgi:nucleoside-diphosphate-sugar epimerase
MLVRRGHQVVGTTRSTERIAKVRELGAEPVVVDPLDRTAVLRAIEAVRPAVIVHELTALGSMRSLKRFDEDFAVTNRLRTEGIENLLEAARASGAVRLVAQSFAGWPNAREGGRVKSEDDPLDTHPPASMRRTLEAIRHVERVVPEAAGIEGIVLRYGSFYGPGTAIAPRGEIVEAVRRRQFPVVGSGAGVWSFVHIDDVALATAIAMEGVPSGIYNIVDDEPAEVATWLPELARVIGAKPPRRVPAWLGRFVIGEAGVLMMTNSRGSSNAKARRVFNWRPAYPSWRDGFRRELSGGARAAA